jgi:hypothetical protein
MKPMFIVVATFERENFKLCPAVEEKVAVVFRSRTDCPDEGEPLERFEQRCYRELWRQYPIWKCPYHAGRPPRTVAESYRHGFSSALLRTIRCYPEAIVQAPLAPAIRL